MDEILMAKPTHNHLFSETGDQLSRQQSKMIAHTKQGCSRIPEPSSPEMTNISRSSPNYPSSFCGERRISRTPTSWLRSTGTELHMNE